jgi:hypothetical protein
MFRRNVSQRRVQTVSGSAPDRTSILKFKADWQHENEAWKKRPLRGRYVYLYADGVYLKASARRANIKPSLEAIRVPLTSDPEVMARSESAHRECALSVWPVRNLLDFCRKVDRDPGHTAGR